MRLDRRISLPGFTGPKLNIMTRTDAELQELNPDRGRSTGADSLTSLMWLTLGAFAIGTEGFMIAGLLPALARRADYGRADSRAGAALPAGRRHGRLRPEQPLAALAPGYAGLLAARLLLALSAASFMPAASGYAAALGGPERRARAPSTVTTGSTLAIIVGVPLGVLGG
jgi:predicted MFS family arabinose efflux permease